MAGAEDSHAPLVRVRRYQRLTEAREAALVLAAKGLLYEIDPEEDGWLLMVEERLLDFASRELQEFETEALSQSTADPAPISPLRWEPLLFPAILMCAFFQVQQRLGSAWTEAGVADGDAIVSHGEWWRTVTALTLHADLPHLLANMLTGLTFAAFLEARWGTGFAWLLIVLSGAVGNLVNSWGYRGEAHFSLGASTAVFGALGLLVASELLARWRGPGTRTWWHLVVPVGAGLSLLAFLGVGEKHEHIDFMAHCWGFISGFVIGAAATGALPRERPTPRWQHGAAVAVSLLLAGSWWLALRAP